MDLRSSLGFGFFNKTRAKGRKRSERQLADLYDKVAIRGSIQHVWGDDSPRGLVAKQSQPTVGKHTIATPVQDEPPSQVETQSTTLPSTHDSLEEFGQSLRRQAATPDVAPPLAHYHNILPTPGALAPSSEDLTGHKPAANEFTATASPQFMRSMSPSQRSTSSLSFEGTIPQHAVHKKFSFCPSTISLVSPRSPSGNLRGPRSVSLTGSNHPYSRRSSVFSSSTPSVQLRRSSAARDSLNDEQVAIADEVLDTGLGIHTFELSPASSLHYTTSIVSRISSTGESVQLEDPYQQFLPGQIYASPLPDALRGIHYKTFLPERPLYGEDEDDDDAGSDFSGLSEVNAGHSSDSDFRSDDDEEEEQTFAPPPPSSDTLLTTDLPDTLRRDSVVRRRRRREEKRVSYTKLESGEYLATVESRRRSASPPLQQTDLQRAGSTASHWTIEQEFVSQI